jgi:hypothetical protein
MRPAALFHQSNTPKQKEVALSQVGTTSARGRGVVTPTVTPEGERANGTVSDVRREEGPGKWLVNIVHT